jgi:dipeptidyl aminopeptidase/acylaminoacyl peptidase
MGRISSWFLVAALLLAAGCASQETVTKEPEVTESRTPRTYSVEDLYQNTTFRGAWWSPDKSKILVASDLSGIVNAYAVSLSGGDPQPLTRSTTNSVFPLSYFPADERLLYVSDEAGNELTHVFVQDPDGSRKDLTPGAKLKANFHGWAGDDRSFFVSTNERDDRYFDLYEISVDGYKRTLLYRNTNGYNLGPGAPGPCPISRDKRYLALVKSRTLSDADIFLHDRRAGTTKNITAHQGNVNNSPSDFSPDGARLLFTSDAGREFASLRVFDIRARSTSPLYEDQWDVLGALYSRGGKYLTVYVNEDSRFAARVLDASTLKPVSLTGMASAVVRGVSISPDESSIAFNASDGSVPEDLYAGTFTGSPRRLTDALNPNIRREDLVVPTVVRFRAADGVSIPGLLYKPHQASAARKAPALVMVHGGPGAQAQVGFSALIQALVNHGYVVFDINNRGSSGYGKTFFKMDDRKHGEADLADVVASKAMLVETGYVDPQRIAIIGGSYGGYMVLAALTLQPDAFKAGVDLFGVSNWVRTLSSIPAWSRAERDALYAELGDPNTDAERLRRISPLFNAENIKVPLMVLQGANDPRVLKVESDEVVAAAKKNGVPVEYIVFPDEGHGFVKKANEIKGYSAVIAFLDKYVKGASTGRSTN